jgi:O-antigen/teichoic acid export membrane protein
VSAGAWGAIDILLRHGVQFLVSLILARLLTPADFGLIAILGFFSGLSLVLVTGGLSMALVQRQDTSPEEESAVFWCNLAAISLFAALMVAVGPLLARFYEQPMLASLMWVAAAQVILSAMGSVHHALLSRRLALKQLTKCGAAASFVSGALGIAAALAGWGVWALAVQMIIASLVYSIALWLALPWRPRLRVRLTAARPLWSFGLWVSMSSILDVAYSQGFALIVGKLHGVRDLGLFGRAQSIQSLPLAAFAALQRIALPLFVERLNDPEGLRIGFRKAISLTMLPTVPMMAGLALVADLLIVVLFGEQWRDAAPILVILTAAAVLAPMHTLNLNLLLARGESKHYLALEIRKKLVGVACVVAGSFFGIAGLAWSQVVFSAVALVINIRPTARSLGYGVIAQLLDLRGIVLATGLMSIAVLAAKSQIVAPPLPKLAALVALGGVTFLLAAWALRLQSLSDGWDAVTQTWRAKRNRPSESAIG